MVAGMQHSTVSQQARRHIQTVQLPPRQTTGIPRPVPACGNAPHHSVQTDMPAHLHGAVTRKESAYQPTHPNSAIATNASPGISHAARRRHLLHPKNTPGCPARRRHSAAWGQVPCRPSRSDFTPEARTCLRLIDSCITQLKAQGPSRTYNESKEEEEETSESIPPPSPPPRWPP